MDAISKMKRMLGDLRPNDSEFFGWAHAFEQFTLGNHLAFDNGVTVDTIDVGINSEGKQYITLDVFMPKGTNFSKNHHDFFEFILPLFGEGIDRVTPHKLRLFHKHRVPIGRAHTIDAKTDFRFISQLINTDKL